MLEALVAIAIAALAMAALYRGTGQSTLAVVSSQQRVEAALLANSVLAQFTFAEDVQSGMEGRQGPWRWTVTLDPAQVPIVAPLFGATVTGDLITAPAGRVTIHVYHEQVRQNQPVFNLTGWKPYRTGGGA